MISNYFAQLTISTTFLAVLWGGAQFLKKKISLPSSVSNKRMKILEKNTLGKNKSLILMKFDNKEILLGITDHQISVIDEMCINEKE